MKKVLLFLYITCYACYIFYTRTPDYFDGETTTGIVHINETKQAIASYTVNDKAYTVPVSYPLRSLSPQQNIPIIYHPAHPEQSAMYSLWGYWFTWGEVLMSLVLLFALYQLAVSITKNPSEEETDSEEVQRQPKYN